MLAIFVPTALDKAEHDALGAKLWVDELFFWFGNPGTNEKVRDKCLYTLARCEF